MVMAGRIVVGDGAGAGADGDLLLQA